MADRGAVLAGQPDGAGHLDDVVDGNLGTQSFEALGAADAAFAGGDQELRGSR